MTGDLFGVIGEGGLRFSNYSETQVAMSGSQFAPAKIRDKLLERAGMEQRDRVLLSFFGWFSIKFESSRDRPAPLLPQGRGHSAIVTGRDWRTEIQSEHPDAWMSLCQGKAFG